MHGVEGQVEQPWLFLVLFNKCNRLAPEGFGGIIQLIDILHAAQNAIFYKITVGTAQEAIKLFEPTFLRVLIGF